MSKGGERQVNGNGSCLCDLAEHEADRSEVRSVWESSGSPFCDSFDRTAISDRDPLRAYKMNRSPRGTEQGSAQGREAAITGCTCARAYVTACSKCGCSDQDPCAHTLNTRMQLFRDGGAGNRRPRPGLSRPGPAHCLAPKSLAVGLLDLTPARRRRECGRRVGPGAGGPHRAGIPRRSCRRLLCPTAVRRTMRCPW